ncbi:MAG: 3-oxoacyl-[acyl-carrier-protein] reductase [Planctomycetes bacterium]|nr:3-oxoacyl-[acyl-carrier-protein] reductase [Planctomycetota bacterium]MDP6410566.1 3-oxoacyl-[acyl-carrier-protein] reductase [Planctomycetota bacterium]
MSDPSQPPARDLEGRVALVTGASRGIGRAIAVRLAVRGARVACVATRAENCEDTVEACAAETDGARAYGVDVADTQAVAALVAQVRDELDGLAVLVNNAGVTRDQLLLRMSEEDFDRVIEVNLKGSWNFLKAAARPLMKARGKIVNISSVVGLTGNAGQVNYAASKAGIHGMTRSLAKELAGRGVCVNAVAPGFVATDMTADLTEGSAQEWKDSIPLGRIGTPDDVAAAVEFLIGPGGDYITGQVIVVDGGLSL